MITDTNERLGTAVYELRNLIVGFTSYSSLFPPSSCRFTGSFFLPYPRKIQSKADPALSEAQELLNAEEEMEAAAI